MKVELRVSLRIGRESAPEAEPRESSLDALVERADGDGVPVARPVGFTRPDDPA